MNKLFLSIILILIIVVAGGFFLTRRDGNQYTSGDLHLDIIRVASLTVGDRVTSPLTVTGEARGNWFFEASFPVRLLDANGVTLASTFAMTASDWMTTDFVPWSTTIEFPKPTTETGILILQKDNPSGEAQFDDSISIPVRFVP